MKLLVRNLARSTTEAELKEMFEAFGRVQSCNLVMDQKTGSSKGFGFVEMPKPGEAKAAMKNLNGKDVAGNKIRVKKAEDKPTSPSDPSAARVATAAQPESPQKKPRPTLTTRSDKTKPKAKKAWPEKSETKQKKAWKNKPKQERSERPRQEPSEQEQPKPKSPVNPWTKNR